MVEPQEQILAQAVAVVEHPRTLALLVVLVAMVVLA
jgi:hypothetical protein